MKLFCPECGAGIAAEDIDLASSMAKCRSCAAVFSFKDSLAAEEERASRRVQATELAIAPPKPPKMRLEDAGGDFVISWPWFTLATLGMTFFCIAWDSFLVFWYAMALRHNGPWLMIVFPICHVGVGVGLTYWVLCGYLNRTRITLSAGELLVRHGPLPWFGNRLLQNDQIRQLYCEEQFQRSCSANSRQFQLSAMLADNTRITLIKGLASPGEARFLESALEQRLKISPQRVPGEYRD